jgi:hypothetical protein
MIGIHEGTSMIITPRSGEGDVIKGVVDHVRYFESGPNRGRAWQITIKPLDDSQPKIKMIRNRSQLGGGWINKTHVAKISPQSW